MANDNVRDIVSVVPSGEEACPALATLLGSLGTSMASRPVITFRAPHAWRRDPTRIRMEICMRCGAAREEPREGE